MPAFREAREPVSAVLRAAPGAYHQIQLPFSPSHVYSFSQLPAPSHSPVAAEQALKDALQGLEALGKATADTERLYQDLEQQARALQVLHAELAKAKQQQDQESEAAHARYASSWAALISASGCR